MNNKLPDNVDYCINSYSEILIDFAPEGQKQISRFFDVNSHHVQILHKLDVYSKNFNQITSAADGQHMKKILIDSLELADRKVDITKRLGDMVNDNISKLNTSLKKIKMSQLNENNEANDKSNKMLNWVPEHKEMDSDSLFEELSVNDLDNHSNNNKTKITNNIQAKSNLDGNIEPSEKISTDTKQKQLKNTIEKKNLTKKQCKRRKQISESFTDSDVEPTYCICEKVSYGNMVYCDNDLCPIQWFHFKCVSLSKKPKGKWYCPRCRGTNSKQMKPKEIVLLELAKYNKQKEDDFNKYE
ncbi:Zinc finger, PHD-finger,Zinc finger, PHD-type,Zinc finger, FYVE/PHD-type,Zinc finger, PHD-type [Cinara cedri]|uniref:Inhibitor of growth protein 3 n=1 Tax=Cinara cedri TaxID=506608 RepID=A0A5E4MCZ9_9HEMI|nr:Zinc finger, PHD-finger,Zinc finger, PHD-type,Zinc finger, FYVE/PHD-type,Zinc finger, PHD-type [Cinara cedri]